MTSLRCFKGPLDGERRDVDGVAWGRVIEFAVLPKSRLEELQAVATSKPFDRVAYRVERLITPSKNWWFLVYNEVDTETFFEEWFG